MPDNGFNPGAFTITITATGQAVMLATFFLRVMACYHPKTISAAIMLICLFFVLFCSVGIYFEDQVSPGVHFFLLPGA